MVTLISLFTVCHHTKGITQLLAIFPTRYISYSDYLFGGWRFVPLNLLARLSHPASLSTSHTSLSSTSISLGSSHLLCFLDSTRKLDHLVSIFLHSCQGASTLSQMGRARSFSWLGGIPLNICSTFFSIHPLMSTQIVPAFLTHCKQRCSERRVGRVSSKPRLPSFLLWPMPGSGIAMLCGGSAYGILRKLHSVFHILS